MEYFFSRACVCGVLLLKSLCVEYFFSRACAWSTSSQELVCGVLLLKSLLCPSQVPVFPEVDCYGASAGPTDCTKD